MDKEVVGRIELPKNLMSIDFASMSKFERNLFLKRVFGQDFELGKECECPFCGSKFTLKEGKKKKGKNHV